MRKIVFSLSFILLCFVVNSQNILPKLPDCKTPNTFQDFSIQDLISKSYQSIEIDATKAFCFLLQAEINTSNKNEKIQIADNAGKLGTKLYLDAQYKEAINFQSLSGQLWFALDSIELYSKSLRKTGENFHKLGDIYNSLIYLNEAKEINEKHNYISEKYHTYIALAWSYRQVRNFNEAEKHISLSKLMIDNKIMDTHYYDYYYLTSQLARTKANYSLAQQYKDTSIVGVDKNTAAGFIAIAMKYNDSTILVAKENDDKNLLAKAISNRANFLIYTRGNTDSIIAQISYALEINHQMNDKQQLASNYGVLSKAYLYNKNYSQAIQAANTGLDYANEANNSYEAAIKYDLLKEAHKEIGDYKKALSYAEKYQILYKEVYGLKDYNKIFEIQKIGDEKVSNAIIANLKITSAKNRQIYWLVSIISLLLFLGIIGYYINLKNNQKRKNEILKAKAAHDLLQIEMEALRARMNPHFLFNSLNSIKSYITKNDAREASNYLTKFSTLVRMILNHSKEKVISLEDELKAINYYLEIEKMRLKDTFDFVITIDESLDVSDIFVPPSIMQPFAENSIWHGFSQIAHKGLLQINLSGDNKKVIIEIEDNGIGREKAKLLKMENSSYRSMGTNIIKKTVEVFNQEKLINLDIKTIDLYTPNREPQGTKVIIIINAVSS